MESSEIRQRGDAQHDDVIDLFALVRTLWRGKWIVGLATVLCILAGGYYAYVAAVPTFISHSVVILEPQQEQIVSFDSVVAGMSGDDAEVSSEVQVLRSRELIRKVVEKLDLIEDPEFNSSLRQPGTFQEFKAAIRAMLPLPQRSGAGSDALTPEESEMQNTVSAVLDALSISNLPKTYVLQISVETESARKSALLADTVADQYILDQINAKFEATEQASSWLAERVTELQGELEQSETALAEFSQSIDLISPEALQLKERQIKDLRDRVATVSAEAAQAEALAAALAGAGDRQAAAAASGDPELGRMAQQLLQTPGDTALQTRFDLRAQSILKRAELEAARSRSQVQTLQRSQETLDAEYETQSQDLIKLQQLMRETEASRLLYEYFLGRLKETSVQKGIQQADARVLSYGVIPASAAAPKKSLILAVCGILGVMLGSGLVFLKEAQTVTFRTARDIERKTGHYVLGQIPLFPSRARKRAIAYLAQKPNSSTAEAIRNLRTSVLLSNVDDPPQVIMITSAVPGEGKTTLTLALANNFAGIGRRVLVIEGDIRRHVIGRYLEGRKSPDKGLIAVLDGTASAADVITRSDEVNVDILLSERATINAGDLFSSQKFADLISSLRGSYDTILIDTPPVLVVPDARMIAQVADAVLFVVRWDATGRDQVEDALHQLDMVKCRPAGLVLNQISGAGMKAYGYGYYAPYGSKYYND